MGEEGVRGGASQGEVHEDPDQEDGHEDGPTRAADEACRPRQGEAEEELPGREAVGGKLHGPLPGARPEDAAEEEGGGEPYAEPQEVEAEDHQGGVLGKEGEGEKGEDRQPRPTGQEGDGQGHPKPIQGVGQGLGGVHGGNVAAEAEDQGDEGLPGKPRPAHQAVGDEGHSGQEARGLQEGQGQVEEEEDGGEGEDRLHPGPGPEA